MSAMFVLVDANNFYATCEKAFDPTLDSKPVVVLSNNDGCVVARSAEAKSLGIPMGAPIHEWKNFCSEHGVVIKSSNYTLYGDMSARMLHVLQDLCPEVESYSIDESFLNVQGMSDLTEFGYHLRSELRRRSLMTCGVGIGPTKTLAKFANLIAKKHPAYGGVFNLVDHEESFVDELMATYPVDEVWGVGRQLSKRLMACDINTVRDLKYCNHIAIRKEFGIVLERTVMELRGKSCLSLEEVVPPKQQIMASRSFGRVIADPHAIKAAMINHVSRAAEKLRLQKSVAQHVYVSLRTNPFRQQDLQYRRTTLIPLDRPTCDTSILIKASMAGLRQIYLPGFKYHKCGVMLSQLSPQGEAQTDLFTTLDDPKRLRLMALVDTVNDKYGRGTLQSAGIIANDEWKMRSANVSPMYTTKWSDILVAK